MLRQVLARIGRALDLACLSDLTRAPRSDARRVELDHVPVGAGAMGARVVETEVYRKNVR